MALLVTVTLPGTSPAPAGAKVTFSVAVCPDVKIRPDETPLAVYPAPETVTFEIVTSEFPPLVKITGRTLLLPILTVEKFRLVLLALRMIVGVPGVPCWLEAVLGALVTPVQPEIDRIAENNTTGAAAETHIFPVERAYTALFHAPLNPLAMLEILILVIVNCRTRRDYCPSGHL